MENRHVAGLDLLFLISICVAVFLYCMVFALAFKAEFSGDIKQFDALGWNLARGSGFVDEALKPTMFREPGYPGFLALIYRIFGHSVQAVVITQSILYCAIVVMTFFLARYIFDKYTAKIATVMAAAIPTLANYASYLLSEVFFTFCLMVFVIILTKSLDVDSYFALVGSGIILAIMALTKAIMIGFILFVIAASFILHFGEKDFLKKFLLRSAVLCLAVAICVAPWIIRNGHLFGNYSMALRGGKALYNRAIKLDYGWDKWKKIAVFSVSEFLGDKLCPNEVSQTRDFLLIEDHMAEAKAKELEEGGLTPAEADKILTKEAMAKISKRPALYLGQSVIESLKLLGFMHIPSLNENAVQESFKNMKNGKVMLSAIRGIFRLLAYPIIMLCFAGMSASLKDWRKWLIMFLVILYITLSYSLTFSWARYTVPLIPLYVIFASKFIADKLQASRG